MTPGDQSWAVRLRAKGLKIDEIARLLCLPADYVRRNMPGVVKPSTFVNGRGWV